MNHQNHLLIRPHQLHRGAQRRGPQGDSGDCFFIVMEGECVAMKAGVPQGAAALDFGQWGKRRERIKEHGEDMGIIGQFM